VLGKRLAVLFWLIAVSGISLAAQQSPDAAAPAESRLAGIVRSPEGAPVPGATLRIVQSSTGKAWVSWTDENGKFELPGLPEGHFRVQVSQIGFTPAVKEIDLTGDSKAPLELKLEVATLAELTPPAATEEKANLPGAGSAKEPAKSSAPNPSADVASGRPAPSGPRRARNGPPPGPSGERPGQLGARNGAGNESGRQGGGQRSFQQVGLSGTPT